MDWLAWGSLAAGLLFLGSACRAAAQSPYADMGGQMFFSGQWLLGSIAIAAATGLLVVWWAGLLAGIAVFALRWPAYRLCEGWLAEPLPPAKDGFKEFIKRTEKND
jgi:hypothetical protein